VSLISVHNITRCKVLEGRLFGIEIEAEGHNLPCYEEELTYPDDDEDCDEPIIKNVSPDLKEWEIHEEGSITNGAEYVLKTPMDLGKACHAVDWLFDELRDKYQAVLKESPRTSVHIHINASDWSLGRLKKSLPILAAAEPFLVEMSGRHRRGNLFCLSRLDAPFGWKQVINLAAGAQYISGDTHYCGINFKPLYGHGSIEFRMMRGLTTAADVQDWLFTLDALIDAIDLVPNDWDWKELPSPLFFFLMHTSPASHERLLTKALRSAKEVVEELALAAIPQKMPQISPAPSPSIHLTAASSSLSGWAEAMNTLVNPSPVTMSPAYSLTLEEFTELYPPAPLQPVNNSDF